MITKKETCECCNGDGYCISEGYYDYDNDWMSSYKYGCTCCGGSGDDNNPCLVKPNIKKGSGKKEVTYKEITCTECNGDKKVRYYKDNYSPSMSLFGNVTEKEKKSWEKKFTVVKTCQRCGGSGIELEFVSSKPASKGWF